MGQYDDTNGDRAQQERAIGGWEDTHLVDHGKDVLMPARKGRFFGAKKCTNCGHKFKSGEGVYEGEGTFSGETRCAKCVGERDYQMY